VYEIIPQCLLIGGGAVRLFFAISGFVVTLSLREKLNAIQGDVFLDRLFSAKGLLLSFYKKRFFRIFPVVLFTTILLGTFLNFTENDLTWAAALFRAPMEIFWGAYNNTLELFALREKVHLSGLGLFWTLAVEAQFYILWPIILLACRNDNARAIVSLSLGLLFVLLIKPVLDAHYGEKYYLIYDNLSELFLGSFLAFLYGENSSAKSKTKFAQLVAAVLAMTIWFYPNTMEKNFYSTMVISFSSVLLVALAVFSSESFKIPVLHKVFDYIGSRSFSFYAVQLTLANIVVYYTNSIYFPKEAFSEQKFYCYQFVIFIVALGIVTELTYRFIEKPFRQFGRR
jgi:peptidoglycan/LPS O-acetylase OafA/YrhL